MTVVVRWEEPPPRRNAVHDWARIGEELLAHPGEWGLVALAANAALAGSTARYVRDGKYSALRRIGHFDAKARTVDGEHRIYARYVGGAP